MIEYEQIAVANAAIKTTNIKGKEYAEVNQRIKAFRSCYPSGFIITEPICGVADVKGTGDGVCAFRAQVGYYDEDGSPKTIGVGTAYEKESSSYINKTSYIENCETSAVGRALGMAGFGIDAAVASAEEVANAMLNQLTAPAEQPKKTAAKKTAKPAADPPQPAAKWHCVECHAPIVDSGGKTADAIYNAAMERYHKPVCLDCFKKLYAAEKAAAKATEAAEEAK